MDYGRWSNRIFTVKPHAKRRKRERERQLKPIDHKRATESRFRSFVKAVFRGRVKT
jgi:hypothetical protein